MARAATIDRSRTPQTKAKMIVFAQRGPRRFRSCERKYVLADGRPALPICRASATVTLRTASAPRPSGPSQRPTITLAPTAPTSINRRVAKVSATPPVKLPNDPASIDLTIVSPAGNPAVIPNTQVQQTPEVCAPVALFAPVFIGQALDESIIKEIAFADR